MVTQKKGRIQNLDYRKLFMYKHFMMDWRYIWCGLTSLYMKNSWKITHLVEESDSSSMDLYSILNLYQPKIQCQSKLPGPWRPWSLQMGCSSSYTYKWRGNKRKNTCSKAMKTMGEKEINVHHSLRTHAMDKWTDTDVNK